MNLNFVSLCGNHVNVNTTMFVVNHNTNILFILQLVE